MAEQVVGCGAFIDLDDSAADEWFDIYSVRLPTNLVNPDKGDVLDAALRDAATDMAETENNPAGLDCQATQRGRVDSITLIRARKEICSGDDFH
jgi:hypothetical protein